MLSVISLFTAKYKKKKKMRTSKCANSTIFNGSSIEHDNIISIFAVFARTLNA